MIVIFKETNEGKSEKEKKQIWSSKNQNLQRVCEYNPSTGNLWE
jgi:hypothetical protein